MPATPRVNATQRPLVQRTDRLPGPQPRHGYSADADRQLGHGRTEADPRPLPAARAWRSPSRSRCGHGRRTPAPAAPRVGPTPRARWSGPVRRSSTARTRRGPRSRRTSSQLSDPHRDRHAGGSAGTPPPGPTSPMTPTVKCPSGGSAVGTLLGGLPGPRGCCLRRLGPVLLGWLALGARPHRVDVRCSGRRTPTRPKRCKTGALGIRYSCISAATGAHHAPTPRQAGPP